MNIGMKETIGTVDSSPIRPAPQPHWKTITRTPYAAPMLSRFMAAALRGTRRERKSSVRRRHDSSTTTLTNTGSRRWTRSPASAKVAVCPPTCARAGLPASAAGSTCERSRWIVVQVASSWGPEVGYATRVATPAPASTSAADTVATPASVATACRSDSTTPGSPEVATAITSGPLAPGPNPSATRS